ncbi:hypothetical protein STENM327S_00131 [Streptomyces tendae]
MRGHGEATVDAAEQTAATVSAARRAEDLLANGIASGDVTWRRDEGGTRGATGCARDV